MVMIELKGIHRVRSKGKTYYYAWRGGPALKGEPGTPAFIESYNEAVQNARAPDPAKFKALISEYKRKAFPRLAKTTQEVWGPWLDRIGDHFGDLRTVQFGRTEKIQPIIRKWRNGYADTPRAADIGVQVLSVLCAYAIERGKISTNPCEGIKALYSNSRAEIIWEDGDIAQLKATCSSYVAYAVDLASHTGLRVSDLIRLSWNHVGDDAIVMTTGKSDHKREAIIPLYDDLRAVLARIPKRSPTILTNSRGRPWTRDGLGSSFNKAKIEAKLHERDLHFHDLRGTAATKFYVAGLSMRLIAEIMGWEEETVERIIRRYVTRGAAIRAAILELNKAKKGT